MTEKDFSLRLAKLREEKGVSARDMSRPKPSSIIKLDKGGVIKIIRE